MKIIEEAVAKGQKSLSEFASKQFLASYGIPVCRESLVQSEKEAVKKAKEFGFPVVLKACGATLTHKTEGNLIRLWLRGPDEVQTAYRDLTQDKSQDLEGILVQEMVAGHRELVIGLIRDAQFGPCVMFGFGGIFTEVLNDVSFRVAPLEEWDAMEMMEEIRAKKILEAFRGEAAVDRRLLAESLIALGRIGLENDSIEEIDVNPLKFRDGKPVAVDALVVLSLLEDDSVFFKFNHRKAIELVPLADGLEVDQSETLLPVPTPCDRVDLDLFSSPGKDVPVFKALPWEGHRLLRGGKQVLPGRGR